MIGSVGTSDGRCVSADAGEDLFVLGKDVCDCGDVGMLDRIYVIPTRMFVMLMLDRIV